MGRMRWSLVWTSAIRPMTPPCVHSLKYGEMLRPLANLATRSISIMGANTADPSAARNAAASQKLAKDGVLRMLE